MSRRKKFAIKLLQLFRGKSYNDRVSTEPINTPIGVSFDELFKEEDDAVNAAIRKLDSIKVPPDVARKLGLSENWKDKISPDFLERVAKTARKNARALKELSKY